MVTRLVAALERRLRRFPERSRRARARLRAFWVKHMLRRPIWYTDRNGVTFQLRPSDALAHYFYNRQFFDDANQTALLARLVRAGMILFDVGAHWGEFTLFTARLVGPLGCIHAFEPTAYSYERLMKNLSAQPDLASRVRANRVAVARELGALELHTFPSHLSSWNSLGVPRMRMGNQQLAPTGVETVSTTSLGVYCAAQGIERVDLLKVDVEGFEDEVIAGADGLLRAGAIDYVLFEISLSPLEGCGKTPRMIFDSFAPYAYRLHLIGPEGALIPINDPRSFEAPFFANYLAIRSGLVTPA